MFQNDMKCIILNFLKEDTWWACCNLRFLNDCGLQMNQDAPQAAASSSMKSTFHDTTPRIIVGTSVAPIESWVEVPLNEYACLEVFPSSKN